MADDDPSVCAVEVLAREPAYEGFHRVERIRLRHERFDGAMGGPLTREVVSRGTAVAVLPYDPRADAVLLIRGFLPGSFFGGGPARPLQVIAGMVEPGEDGEAVARREAEEEAGVRLARLEPAHAFLPSPGGSTERVAVFAGEADLAAAGGVHGLAEEGEDLRAEVVPAAEAIALLDAGVIESGPAVVALSWFARHRERLRAAWG